MGVGAWATNPVRSLGGASSAPSPRPMGRPMSDTERYLFDLHGYLVVRGALSAEEVAEGNAAIAAHAGHVLERTGSALRNTPARAGAFMGGDGKTGRGELGELLNLPADAGGRFFRRLLAHPNLVPYLHEVVGAGYRLDHMPLVIQNQRGSEGFSLHGGTVGADGTYNPDLAYQWSHGKMYNALVAVSVALTDVGPGDGGFVVIPGSHKANYPTPAALIDGLENVGDALVQPTLRAGDAVIFSEGTVHGAAAWQGEGERRLALYRFAPACRAYGRAYLEDWKMGEDAQADLTDAERAVLAPPFANRLERPQVDPENVLDTRFDGRSEAKKAWDMKVYQSAYF